MLLQKLFMHQLEIKLKLLVSRCYKLYVMGCKPVTNTDLKILYSSPNFLVVNKDFDIPINSETPDKHPVTVATQLAHAFPHLVDPSVTFGFRFCHRLDYSTSGVLCIGLNKKAAQSTTKTFTSKLSHKFYLALLHGHVESDSFTIDKGIGFDTRPEYTHRMCTSDKEYCERRKWAITRLVVLQRGEYDKKPATKVLLKLVSGRRHQLRVHCHDIGHTVVGDFTYSDRTDIYPYRMFLHSLRLVLPNDVECLDVCTEDPFTEHVPENLWCPIETVNDLHEGMQALM